MAQDLRKNALPGVRECIKLMIWLAKAKCLEVIDFRPDTWNRTKRKWKLCNPNSWSQKEWLHITKLLQISSLEWLRSEETKHALKYYFQTK